VSEKYELKWPFFPDPAKDDLVFFSFGVSNLNVACHVSRLGPRQSLNLKQPYEVGISFDTRLPLKPQLNNARLILEETVKFHVKRGIIDEDQAKERRNQCRLYRTYLRLLDAKVVGADTNEIARVLFGYKTNDPPEHHGKRSVRDSLEAAKKLRDSGFRMIIKKAKLTK
jgi:hypothetical protein